ncbi:UNVERIFIED_CONTAM: Phosphatidylinositol 4-phosphate 5-kinase [Sesamum angustifolium]|uniref:Phosphatidylinositol 4-phosphate 5-kinase n=1 Tax=Sesamum angustifolium TaxID=2727405 RepID=A0AAW2N624_9LAMI
MSGPVAIANKVQRALSLSDRTKSLDSLVSNDKIRLTELNGEVSHASSESNAFRSGEILLPHGESYSGSLLGNIPEGSGDYVWADGCKYEGEWRRGMRHGYGKIQWPSGAVYDGEFAGGYMHGTGTYTRSDNLTYKGRWRLNLKHGLGYQNFPNGDVFEGSWIQGTLKDQGGKMSGKGTLTWISGDSFEGSWLNGMMHGFGVYTWTDGGCYVGTWTRGLKDGKGTFYPKGSRLPAGQQLYLNALRKQGLLPDFRKQNQVSHIQHATSVDIGRNQVSVRNSSDKLSKGSLLNMEQSRNTNVSLERRWSLEVSIEKVLGHSRSSSVSEAILDGGDNEDDMNPPILEREYMQGVLISELVLSNRFSPSSRRAKRRQKRLAREIKRPGEQIIKGHRSYDLMLSLQLGIRYTVGKITPIQRREVRATDFGPRASFWMNFPKEGSQLTPPHQSEDFKWKDYCPMVFRDLREMFKIDAADYMMSICGNDALRELSSPGKSGSVFFLSQDDRFMIKTLRKSEVKWSTNFKASLTALQFRFVVMGNMFCTELRIHRRFDLKGSSLGRSADKVEIDENTILKDLDLNYCFYLEPSWQVALLQQIEIDSKFLESENIMDYSLLLGVHYRAPQHLRSLMSYSQRMSVDGLGIVAEDESMEDEISPEGLVLVPRGADDSSVVVGPHIRGSRLRASSSTGDKEVDLLLPGTARYYHTPNPAWSEYASKSMIQRCFTSSIQYQSAVDPSFYSERFLDFIKKVFPPNAVVGYGPE